jgi:amidohydrolase
MIDLRHDLHAHPELAFEEFYTTEVIRRQLAHLGWDILACPTETGAVARLVGTRPGKRIMVRADIDALPVLEDNDLSYRSLNEGVMHACGHDVHTAGVLGVADLLARRRDELAGEFTLIFQPAEEAVGGAKAMIDGGLFTDNPVDAIIAAHVVSLAPVGLVLTRAGIMMSEASAFSVHVTGQGGHGALATIEGNVVLAISALAPRLGDVVEGLNYEGTDCACSAGVLLAGSANNVVPRHATLRGTLRTFTSDQRADALARLREILDDIEGAFSVSCELTIDFNANAVDNHPSVVASVMASAASVVGPTNVIEIPPVTPSDDFSEFSKFAPSAYVFIGGALADGSSGMHHSPEFLIDDGACRTLAGVLALSAVDLAAS